MWSYRPRATSRPPSGLVADEHGALLWLDEIQSGLGRTGEWFAHDAEVRPDIVTVAKGLGGGFPIGACIGVGDAGLLLEPGNHGTTFGGNPVACAAALAVIRTIIDEHLLEHVTVLGQKLRDGLAADPRVTEVRGEGLFIGLTCPRTSPVRLRPQHSRPASSSTTRRRSGSGSRHRSCSPTTTPRRSSLPGPGSSTRRWGRSSEALPG